MSTVTTFLNLVKPAPLENFSRATYNNNLDLIDARAVTEEKFGKGIIANTDNATNSTGLGGTGVMCDLVVANLVAGRWYSATYRFATDTSIADMAIAVALKKSVTTDSTNAGTDPTSDSFTIYTAPAAGQGCTTMVEFIWKASVTETVNLKMVLARATGAVNYNINGRHLAIRDLGAQI